MKNSVGKKNRISLSINFGLKGGMGFGEWKVGKSKVACSIVDGISESLPFSSWHEGE